ncbi:DUF6151 family protein [Bradyrhizobium sp. DASA03076]|uniref:DUF6151 family protein n=1 Tax=Bradyrhizobium sp. BLXBL-03 TaxID=3395916 RepID=UPI003F72B4A6
MGGQIELRCRCGDVRAVVTDVSPRTVNRVICYCDDCQAFAHQLGRADLLNRKGGSDIVQVAPSTLSFVQGQDRIAGVRLSPKGLYRWYASCCNTPVGNTVSPTIPFVGIIAQAFEGGTSAVDDAAGPPVGAILGKYAVGEPPVGSTGINLSLSSCALSARCLRGRWVGRHGRIRSSNGRRASRSIPSPYCPASSATRCVRCVDPGLRRKRLMEWCSKVLSRPSFRGGPQDRTRNLEIPGSMRRHRPGMTGTGGHATLSPP